MSASDHDLSRVATFYHALYEGQFPDFNERESLENMAEYLRRKAAGWYGLNNYHIVLGYVEGDLVAACVSDYFHKGNAGVIEFLLVSPAARGKGCGRMMLDQMHRVFDDDARRTGHERADYIMGEMNDPFLTDPAGDNLDPFDRARIWGGWGFGVIDFPYVQPALAEDKAAVRNLLLMARPVGKVAKNELSAEVVRSVVHDYLKWAMRFEDPAQEPEYQRMAAFLENRPSVKLTNLGEYAGESAARPLVTREVRNAADLAAVLPVYEANFGSKTALAIGAEEFLALIDGDQREGFQYHFWGIRSGAAQPVEGMASFFSFPWGGFGGYVALTGSLRGTSRLLLARIERQMLCDFPSAKGWFGECDPGKIENRLAEKLRFRRVSVDYRQPVLDARQDQTESNICPPLELRYKPFGRVYDAHGLKAEETLGAVSDIFRAVYGIAAPETTAAYKHLAADVARNNRDGILRLI